MGEPSRSGTHPRDIYFVSPLVDVLVVGGGLSVLHFLIARVVDPRPDPRYGVLAIALLAIFNHPHFAATSFRLYQSLDRMKQFPRTAFLSPVAVAAGCAVGLANPTFAGWWVKLFLIWSGYHYSGQTKGVVLLYARRLGLTLDGWARGLLLFSIYGPWLHVVLWAETQPKLGTLAGVAIPHLVGPMARFPWSWVSDTLLLASIAAAFAFAVLVWRRDRRVLPAIVAVPIAAHAIWHGPGLQQVAFGEFIPIFHSLQYLLIAWFFELKDGSAREGYVPSIKAIAGRTALWSVIVLVLGWALFQAIPHGLAWCGVSLQLAMPCVVASVNIHHFFVDGVIWRLRDPRTRAMLAGNVLDLAGFARAAPPLVQPSAC